MYMAIQTERQDRKQEHRMKGKGIHSRSIFVQLVVFSLLASSMILNPDDCTVCDDNSIYDGCQHDICQLLSTSLWGNRKGIHSVRFHERHGIRGNGSIHLYDRCPGRTERLERDDRKLGRDDISGAGGLYAGEKEIFVADGIIRKKLKTGDIAETLTGRNLSGFFYFTGNCFPVK